MPVRSFSAAGACRELQAMPRARLCMHALLDIPHKCVNVSSPLAAAGRRQRTAGPWPLHRLWRSSLTAAPPAPARRLLRCATSTPQDPLPPATAPTVMRQLPIIRTNVELWKYTRLATLSISVITPVHLAPWREAPGQGRLGAGISAYLKPLACSFDSAIIDRFFSP